ncbi:sensor histidine kinase [Actinomadura namibiensis]|uniref:histidine kinase n=1 Tax=Actinomadura namibiensis TaxID=182080 RepID=A0A7W3LHR9_ACTNM|nr:histidine kinase [Actinomadura namibiensis]MBA8948406.1 signal transduction histidine kinase [Actinomadura namibiensis]
MRVGPRRPGLLAPATGTALAGLAATPFHGPAAVATATAAAAAMLSARPAHGAGARWSAGVATAVSLGVSLAFLAFGQPEPVPALGYAEMAGLTFLAGGAARWAPPRIAAAVGAAAGVAVVALVLRLIAADLDVTPTTAAIACAIFSAGPAGAAGCGTYLRLLEARRRRAVAMARRDQRLALAHDLHDFVAHDVGAIVAQAQAGQVVAGDPQRVSALFARIEQAGLRALASMDQAVDALHPDGRDGLAPPPGLADLPSLTARYAAAGPAHVDLVLDPGLEVSREAATTAYRVVVEALTNIRRHAPAATAVTVTVRRTADTALEVIVTNDLAGPPGRSTRRAGGLGLHGLAERVRALGGTFSAGPHGPGWRVHAVLPGRTANP